MTVTSGFFNSVAGDRTYDAEDFGRIFAGMIEDGIFKGIGTEFNVLATTGLSLTVGAGRAFFDEIWINNDDLEGVVASAAHSGLPRIDAIVIEVDKSDATRAASIKFKAGVAASTPVPPTMTHTATLDEYPLVHISRAAGSTSITNAHITKLVGTPACPYAVSRLLDRSFDNPISHRTTFRGKNLGSTYTSAQRAAIQNGTFDDLYLGDYWVMNNVTFRIVDINYFLNTGNTKTTTPHLVIMPDTNLANGYMNENFNKGNAGGYYGSDMRALHLPSMRSFIMNAFNRDSNMFMFHDQMLTNAISNGKPSSVGWYTVSLELPNSAMIFGFDGFNPRGDGNNLPPDGSTESTRQFKLFDVAPWYICAPYNAAYPQLNLNTFLRDLISPAVWPHISRHGTMGWATSTSPGMGFRPFFCLNGA